MPKFRVVLVRDMQDSEAATAIVEAEYQDAAKIAAMQDVDWNQICWKSRHDFSSETVVDSVSPADEEEELSPLFDLGGEGGR